MKFAHPEILWALIALAVPVIVHLFNFRRFKRVEFSNVAFLKEVQQETKSRSRLKHLLILTSRLLAILFLVFAFAQPFIPLDETRPGATTRNVSIYIDNSFNMDALSGEGRLLDLAKAKAGEVISAYQATDRFQIITNDLEGRHQRFHSQEDVLDMLDEITVSSAVRPLGEVIQRQQDLIMTSGAEDTYGGNIFVFSDLQESTHRFDGFVPDSAINVRFVPEFATRSANVWIDSIWFDTPVRSLNEPEKLNLRIMNDVAEGLDNVPMKLEINGQQKAIGSFNVIPGTFTDTCLYFTSTTPGVKHCRISIQDHPISYDDDWHFGFTIAAKVKVLVIKEANGGGEFRSIFGNDPFYDLEVSDLGNVNYGRIPLFDLVILDEPNSIASGLTQELASFINDGGTVLFFPKSNGEKSSYNELLLAGGAPSIKSRTSIRSKVSDINLSHPIYAGVFDRIPENIDLPQVTSYLAFSRGSRSGEQQLLTLQNGDPFFFRASEGEGQLFVSAVGLSQEESNFAKHAIFVPTILRVAEFARPSGDMDQTIGAEAVLTLRKLPVTGDASFKLQRVGSEEGYIPRHRSVRGGVEIFLGDQQGSAGNYELLLADSVVKAIGLNYSRDESSLSAYTKANWENELALAGWNKSSVIESSIDTVSNAVEQLDEGKVLWDLFIMLAIAMLVIELLLIKFWKS